MNEKMFDVNYINQLISDSSSDLSKDYYSLYKKLVIFTMEYNGGSLVPLRIDIHDFNENYKNFLKELEESAPYNKSEGYVANAPVDFYEKYILCLFESHTEFYNYNDYNIWNYCSILLKHYIDLRNHSDDGRATMHALIRVVGNTIYDL